MVSSIYSTYSVPERPLLVHQQATTSTISPPSRPISWQNNAQKPAPWNTPDIQAATDRDQAVGERGPLAEAGLRPRPALGAIPAAHPAPDSPRRSSGASRQQPQRTGSPFAQPPRETETSLVLFPLSALHLLSPPVPRVTEQRAPFPVPTDQVAPVGDGDQARETREETLGRIVPRRKRARGKGNIASNQGRKGTSVDLVHEQRTSTSGLGPCARGGGNCRRGSIAGEALSREVREREGCGSSAKGTSCSSASLFISCATTTTTTTK